MLRNLLANVAVLAYAATLSGCTISGLSFGPSGSDEPIGQHGPSTPPVTVNGTWVGHAAVPELGTASRLSLNLQQSGSQVTGSWEIADPDGTVLVAGTTTGSYLRTDVGLTLWRVGAAPVTAAGDVSADGARLELRLQTAGWTPTQFSLDRQ